MSTSDAHVDELIDRLGRYDRELETAQERVEEFGETDLQELADAYEAFTAMLDRYEETVTGDDGDIETIVEFQSRIDEVMGGISEDMLLSETFAECDEYLQKKWFKKSDFAHVREQLQPVADLVERLEKRDEVLAAYRETRTEIEGQIRELGRQTDELERLSGLGRADLGAPTERLREPIETYNDAVTDAFDSFTRDASARAVVNFLDKMESYPLVPFESPPEKLSSFVREYPPGTERISTLLEYANYSHSKLDHYVEDPTTLQEAVGSRQTYFERLDAEPLRVAWPPPPATEVQFRCRELTAAVNRFAPAVVEQLRAVAALPRETEYTRLREGAVAADELTPEERERLQTGDVETELEVTREDRERLRETLDSYPSR
jgi:hypothetical protein